jgi:hypothetical protein
VACLCFVTTSIAFFSAQWRVRGAPTRIAAHPTVVMFCPTIYLFMGMARALAVVVGVASLATCERCRARRRSHAADAPSAQPPPPSRVGSCDRVALVSVCSEYAGALLSRNEASLTATCRKLGGAFAYVECRNTAVLGTCRLVTGEARKFYASGGAAYDAPRAEGECRAALAGTWSALP